MAKYGCPLVSDEEIAVAAEALSKASNHAVQGQGSFNLAYAALTAVRGAHFREAAELKVAVDPVTAENEQMRKIMREINQLCHVPTPGHMRADVHFQRDFDKIRALTKPFT
jgi:hypothetical protein